MKNLSASGVAVLALYIATVPAANLAIIYIGVLPVGFGYAAPAGVYMAGLALVLRDAARERAGRGAVLLAIPVGTVLSYLLANPTLAVASALAFAMAESMDFAVYEPLRKRGLLAAMVGSNIVGIIVDSLIFLQFAFGSLEYLPGQVLGKGWMTVAAVVVLTVLRQMTARGTMARWPRRPRPSANASRRRHNCPPAKDPPRERDAERRNDVQ